MSVCVCLCVFLRSADAKPSVGAAGVQGQEVNNTVILLSDSSRLF